MSNKITGTAPVLASADQRLLLVMARSAMQAKLNGTTPGPQATNLPPALQCHCGVFVSLHNVRGNLRGCLGVLESNQPLYRTVMELAMAAACEDDRFEPLAAGELPETVIEISVLTPLQRVTDIETIKVGRHGLLVRRGSDEGLLLPQVAVEYRWDRDRFLAETCRKAGLSANAWHKCAEIWMFEAEVFQDKISPQRHREY
jgi:AmmeMemoRadiSam system protein A